MEKEILAAIEVLRAGGLILYPTDTVWGIGCDATNKEAVERIYKLKQSQNKQSMLVLCHDADMIVRYVNKAPGIAFDVMEMSEKPLTLILPGAVGVAENLIPEDGTLGVRVPRHEFCEKLLYAERVAVVPGSAFGRGGEGFVRASYCYSTEHILEAIRRIERFLKTLK